MARRYGRNQRRRARELIAHQIEELAALHAAFARESHLLQAASLEAQELKLVLDEARYILGDSVALPPQHWKFSLDKGQESFEAFPPASSLMNFATFESGTAQETATVTAARMHALLVTVQQCDEKTGGMHCLVRLAGKTWGYAISDGALRATPRDALRLRIGREIARQIADHFAPAPPSASRRR